jgi:hypothetical protein
MKHKITEITREDGIGKKTQKPYVKLILKVEGNENYLSGFGNKYNSDWVVGSEVDIDIAKDPKWGWQWKPSGYSSNKSSSGGLSDEQKAWLKKLDARLKAVEEKLSTITLEGGEIPNPVMEDGEIPF